MFERGVADGVTALDVGDAEHETDDKQAKCAVLDIGKGVVFFGSLEDGDAVNVARNDAHGGWIGDARKRGSVIGGENGADDQSEESGDEE